MGFFLSIMNFVKFTHKPVHLTMIVKNIQMHGHQIIGKCKPKNCKQTFLTLSQVLIITPRKREHTHYRHSPLPPSILKEKEGVWKTIFLKVSFLKNVSEECTLCWRVLLCSLWARNPVAAITEFLPLFFTVIINIYIQ